MGGGIWNECVIMIVKMYTDSDTQGGEGVGAVAQIMVGLGGLFLNQTWEKGSDTIGSAEGTSWESWAISRGMSESNV